MNIYFYSGIVLVEGHQTRSFCATWIYIPEEDGGKHEMMLEIIKHNKKDNETVVLTALNKL